MAMAAVMLMASTSTAEAARHDMMTTWAWAWVDDAPFNDPGGAPLPETSAYPRGQVKDRGTPDDYSVNMTITVLGAAGQQLHRYDVGDGSAVYRSLDRRLDNLSAPAKTVRYHLCAIPVNASKPPLPCVDFEVTRPASVQQTPTGTPQGSTPQASAPVDRDDDGVPELQDCNDTNDSVHPGAREYPGNGLDDDCSGGDQAAKMPGLVRTTWDVPRRRNPKVVVMRVRDALPGAQVTVSCEGRRCPFKQRRKTTDRDGEVSLTKLFKRRLRAGVRLEVHIAAVGMITKVTRYDIRRGVVPNGRSMCIPVGALEPQRRC